MLILTLKSSKKTIISDEEVVYFGNDPQNRPLEILIFQSEKKPTSQILQKKWKDRQSKRRIPLLAICIYQDKAYVCGPSGEKPPVFEELDIGQIERVSNEALNEPNRLAASNVLSSFLPSIEDSLPGIRNEGFLSTNELKHGTKNLKDWEKACNQAKEVLNRGNKQLIESLGFDIDRRDNFTNFLRFKDQKRALGILLDRGTSLDLSNPDFANQSPVSHGMSIARQENLPYLIIKSGGLLRIYPVDATKGIGSRGRTETFLEVNTSILPEEYSGLLWLIFSGNALKAKGSLNALIESSFRYGVELADGLRTRVYNDVIPLLCDAIAKELGNSKPSKKDLKEIYDLSLLTLFRLLFIAYSEDRNLLPYKSNEEYKRNSLQTISKALLTIDLNSLNNEKSFSYWNQLKQLFNAVHDGNKLWGVPVYGGNIFSSDKKISLLGSKLENINLENSSVVRILHNLLIADGPEGPQPIDFRSLSIREFGSIYEALLESELVFAKEDLYIEKSSGLYRPIKENEKPLIKKHQIYMQNTSGARKETASYYTKNFAVQHLLKRTVLKALKKHFKKLDQMDIEDASKNFFDFKVVDISMGSGHFLISAIDLIEQELELYRSKRPLSGVSAELSKIRLAANKTLSEINDHHEIDDGKLIRRLIAKRCIYGVDLNNMAVELARLSVWIHTFVPGLPLSFLDRNLIVGDSLLGIGSLDEINDFLNGLDNDGLQQRLFKVDSELILGEAKIHLKKLANVSETTIQDISRERLAWDNAHKAIEPAIALCDIILGSRINNQDFPSKILDYWDDYKIDLLKSDERSNAIKDLNIKNIIHFPTTFPEVFLREKSGFDAIIGNPPWEEATIEKHAFWARYFPGLRGMTQRIMESKMEEYSKNYPELQSELELKQKENETLRKTLISGPYPGMGTGDPDLYKAFCWRFWNLCNNKNGFIGVVVPRSVINSKGSSIFRKTILSQSKNIEAVTLLNTMKWVFDIHAQFIVVLLTIERGEKKETKVKIRGHFESFEKFNTGINTKIDPFLGEDILAYTEDALFPSLPSPESSSLMIKLFESPSINSQENHCWEVYPHAELHATNDKKDKKNGIELMDLISENCPEGYWPVYKGVSFDQLNVDSGEYYAWSDPEKVLPYLQQKRLRSMRNKKSAFSKFNAEWNNDKETLPCLNPRIAFRDITNSLDARSVICALIPPNNFLTNKAPYLLFPKGNEQQITYILGILASISLDWWARRFIGLNLNFFIFNSFPIPIYDENSKLCKRLIEITGLLSCVDDRFELWADSLGIQMTLLDNNQREQLMYELDGVVANLYGLKEEQLIHVFKTYRLNWDYSVRLENTLKYYKQHSH